MPIQLPNIPGMQASADNAPLMDARAAQSSYAALGQVGRSFAEMGESFGKIANDIQRLENRRLVSEQRQTLAQDYANFDLDLQQDPDPVSRNTRTREFFQQQRANLESLDLPSAVRSEMLESFDYFSTRATIRQGEESAKLAVKRSLLTAQNELDTWVAAGDLEQANASINGLESNGLVLPEEAARMRRDAELKIARNNHTRDILADAGGWLERNPAEQIPEGVDPDEWSRLQGYAKTRYREQVAEDSDTIASAISRGNIASNEQLRQQISHLPQSAQDRLLNYYDKHLDENFKAYTNSPKGQQEIIGQARNLLTSIAPNSDDWGAITEISVLVDQLPDGIAKQQLVKKVKDRLEGKHEPSTIDEHFIAQIDQAVSAGLFGQIPEASQTKVSNAITDGFLNDPNKLRSLGWRDDEIEIITGADLEPAELNAWQRGGANSPQAEAFRNLWNQRGKADPKVSQFDWKLAEAIRDRKERVDYFDETAAQRRMEISQRHGAAVMAMNDFFRLNPNATTEEKNAKFKEITGRAISADKLRGFRPPAPGDSARGSQGWDRMQPATATSFGVTGQTRDQLPASRLGARQISLDFNDTASGKSARGVTIVIPSNASPQERQAAQDYVDQTVAWFADNGIEVPNLGVKTETGKGSKVSRFHTEPFFVGDTAAVELMRNKPNEYARILASTLGRIPGATFIAPHKRNDPGASRPGINERDFARQYLIPELFQLQPD